VSIVLSLLAAMAWGISDFAGGLAARRTRVTDVLALTYAVGTVGVALCLPLLPGVLTLRTFVFAAVAGLIGLVGVGFLYAALASGPMNVLSPITGVLSAALPVAAGVLFGERPDALAWTGIVLALVAVVLVSREHEARPHGRVAARPVLMAIGAGCGFGGFFVFLSRAQGDSGLWPVVIARATATVGAVAIALLARKRGESWRPALGLSCVAAVLDTAANVGFLYAARHGLLSIASVVTALYPAGTVLLAMTVLKEKLVPIQAAGLALAAVSVVLVAH